MKFTNLDLERILLSSFVAFYTLTLNFIPATPLPFAIVIAYPSLYIEPWNSGSPFSVTAKNILTYCLLSSLSLSSFGANMALISFHQTRVDVQNIILHIILILQFDINTASALHVFTLYFVNYLFLYRKNVCLYVIIYYGTSFYSLSFFIKVLYSSDRLYSSNTAGASPTVYSHILSYYCISQCNFLCVHNKLN